ncbi:MAG TPA: acetolactate synthase [Clostridiales bacterium]|nr:acetolactate synthase [Clostridiales bacterium]
MVKQISVFLENKSGRLANVTRTLGMNNIDISALSIADTTDFGILRLIVNDPDKAVDVLEQEGFTVAGTDVLAIAVEDKPGGLSEALTVLENNSIGIEYIYAFVGKCSNEALVILRVDEPHKAIEILGKNNIKVLEQEDVYKL